jgi:dinuclear metal center YbgI/SA1388 family protein
MTITELTDYLESIAPLSIQEDYDNCGLLVGDADKVVWSALICLEVTPAVIDEAVEKDCDLIISHHPIIFRGLKKLTGKTYVERTVIEAIRNDIALYAIHTNLDNVLVDGVNGKIAGKLGLIDCSVLSPKPGDLGTGFGAGLVGNLPEPLAEEAFLAWLRDKMELQMIRHTPLLGHPVHRVAVCGGSGSFLLPEAIASGADVFISGDFKYHEFFDADGKIVVADIGHFESERFTMDLIADLIRRKFPNFAAQLTTTVTNPIIYYPS